HNAEEGKKSPNFQALTPLYPDERIKLETETQNYSTRIMDLVTPIDLGQRGLIVAPSKAGKTSLFNEIANANSTNTPGGKLLIL
ncbi:transcription termination factor Rho, partial [Staphylococcus aureus]